MKKILPFLLLFSSSVFADDYFYGGASLSFNDKTSLKYEGVTIDENNDLGFNVFAGYSFLVSETVDLGFELEYQNFGKSDFGSGQSVEGDAYFFNARPKFIEANNNIYSAFILGVGSMSGKVKAGGQSASDSEIIYQVGIEIGYMVDQYDIGVGYRYRVAEFDDVDYTNEGFVLGIRYKF
ncbi:outer membrane beta-barrel protein [Vibrio renipiscarius]|uniref:Outer membrane protein beta-barrel domain-containing protein n=1 Tax=Vibrio renipiscarius TaxID=1461322 RepID=A0A0C2NUE9_9VIBR|nr:outer membrane beta-barrel protein [Vibrio renipiscarius]KII79815.1 hypothetical protein PL18_08170 [Vibrio renipiscarius]KII81078.1 hypothetical protein OJ16_05495 [Vibrio renipiscarius]